MITSGLLERMKTMSGSDKNLMHLNVYQEVILDIRWHRLRFQNYGHQCHKTIQHQRPFTPSAIHLQTERKGTHE
jgi:hypothetical protein